MEEQEKDRSDCANFERDAIEALKNGKQPLGHFPFEV